ncbi:MAG: branched-chain amino acid aminotransferase [Anaerofustis stercorihominis]|nr:branched-chain amino acid aminotransferase [Anaerofustis stercorihominis]
MELQVIKTQNPKTKPAFDQLGFGKYFTDHMFMMTYTEGTGWHDAKICEYGPLAISPAAQVFHYGQATFEGMKAYRDENDNVTLFRPLDNFERMNRSNDRLCMPAIDKEFVLNALEQLLMIEKEWIPNLKDTSLYIRPFMIATESSLGVKVSSEYIFMIILSPVGSYYAEGLQPTSIYVEDTYVRAMDGGTGEAKCAGNYATSLKPYKKAKDMGYSQVLFLDGKERKYVEEVGTSNAFFVIDGKLYTSPLKGTILPGITRDSVIKVAQMKGIEVVEEALAIDYIFEVAKEGRLDEAFASGTAAVISPIGKLAYEDDVVIINEGKIGDMAQMLYDTITGIQTGRLDDPFGWVKEVK